MADYQGPGYHGNLDFWGNQANGSPWWNQDMADSGQALYQDPNTALQAGTLPKELLAKQGIVQQEARQARGGFIGALANDLSSVTGKVDDVMRNVMGDTATNVVEGSAKALWWPIDKAAQGAYWAYSEAISQPLSTLLIKAGESEMGGSSFFGPGWGEAYHKAENVSPGQAFQNLALTEEATGKGNIMTHLQTGFAGAHMSKEDRDTVNRNASRFLTDSEYWRDKQGWKYTAGTGAMDFTLSMGVDPAYAGLKFTSAAVKGARSVKLLQEGEKLRPAGYGLSNLAGYAGEKVGQKFAKTPEEMSRSKRMNDFFDWAASPSVSGAERKSYSEIRQHPIWGSGRRVNPEADRLSSVFSDADRADMPLLLRYAGGDRQAAVSMIQRNADLGIKVQKMQENRVLVDSVKFDPDMLQHFINQESKGLGSPAGIGTPGVVGTSEATSKTGQLMEPPHPRPTTPGPAQQGWDRTYGKLADQSKVYRQAAGEVLKPLNGVRSGIGTDATREADVLRAQQWKADQLDTINKQIDSMSQKQGYYADVLGNDIRKVDDYAPGEANLFGTLSSLYRQGPLALRDTEKAADKAYSNFLTNPDQYGKVASKKQLASGKEKFIGRPENNNFVSRVIRNGFYSPQLRMVHSLSDKVPMTFVNHVDEDAPLRVGEMLKRVKGITPDERAIMLNNYTRAGDKVSRSEALSGIHSHIVERMAAQHGIDPDGARIVDEMIRTGKDATLSKLTGQTPTSQQFAAQGLAQAGTPAGKTADLVEDGESWLLSPLAKTQLQSADALLDVRELEKFFNRHGTYLDKQFQRGADKLDTIKSVGDGLNSMWKAATLLRPGYILRSMSEEQVASAVKFGIMASISDTGRGGANWLLNRKNQLQAEIGKGSYASTLNPDKATIRITDPAAVAAADANKARIEAQLAQATTRGEKKSLQLQLKALGTTRVKINQAWPVVQGRLSQEADGIKYAEDAIEAEKARANPDHDLIATLNENIVNHRAVIDEFTTYGNEMLSHAKDAKGRRLGEGEFEYRGQKVPKAFSRTEEYAIPRDQITSHHANAAIFARSEAVDMNRAIATGSWKTVMPDEAQHMESWLNALNKQFRQDDLFKLVAEDPTLAKAKQWINTPEGRRHRQILGANGRDGDQLIAHVKTVLDSYLPAGTGLQAKLGKGQEVLEHELRGAIDQGSFPPVHGEEFRPLTRKGVIAGGLASVDKMIEGGFRKFGTVPNDVMARQPIYLRAHEARMKQFLDQELSFRELQGRGAGQIEPEAMNAIMKKADKFARKDISQVVYDPTRTTASEALRFAAPFMAAHMDGLERWAGLIAEKPEMIGTAAKVYNAPVAANLVTDQYGNHVDQKGYADVIDPTTGKVTGRKFVPIEDRILNLKVPDGTKNVRRTASMPIKMSALNTILPGDPWWNPGTGPFAQVAASEIAKQSPQLGDFMQWAKILPYGPSQNATDAFIPKQYKDAWNFFTADSAGNDAYQAAYLAEYQRQQADHANGGPVPDMKKVAHNAKQFMFLDALSSFVMPAQQSATPLTGSPYQFFLDQYKTMQQVDPKNAKANFYQKYGDDYFSFTASLSKSLGVQATQTAENTMNKYGDLISQDPTLAPLLVGDIYNQGKFSTSVYRKQMDEMIGGKRVREKISAEEAIRENKKDLGWQQYGQAMNMLDAAMIRSGFKSYNQTGAAPFQDAKRQIIDAISQDNDSWFEDFGTTSTSAVPLRIKTMTRMVEDKELMADSSMNGGLRDDLTGMAMYLGARRDLQKELRARGGRSLSFDLDGNPMGENVEIGNKLRTIQLYLVNNSLGFGDVFHRYLENDDLS